MSIVVFCGVSEPPCGVCDICRSRRRSGRRRKAKVRLQRSNRIRKKAQKKRKLIYKVYGRMCYLCRTVRADTIDHVIPISKGGTNDIENLRPACYDCNHKKGSRIL